MSDAAARRAAVTSRLPQDLDAFLVTNPTNVRYLTGFTGSNGQLLLATEPLFLTDGRYQEQSERQVSDLERHVYTQTRFLPALTEALSQRGIRRLGVEAAHVTLEMHSSLTGSLPEAEVVPLPATVEAVRARKAPVEIEAIRRAQRIAEKALSSVLGHWERGTELEMALELEAECRRAGAEGMSFEVIVAGGAHAALPHATPRPVPVAEDAVLLIDMGARIDGYCSDMTRTFLRGGPDPLPKAHAAVVRALEAACEAVRPGAGYAQVDRAAREVIEQEGFGDAFIHSTGHGVGLEIHEPPRLAAQAEGALEEGMVVTVEPGVYLPGVGGVRVEDLVVVTARGYENLTSFPRGPDWPVSR